MWFYKESYWYKQRLHGVCGSTKNHTGTNRDSRVYASIKNHTGTNRDISFYVVLQRIILVQMKAQVSMWLYKESYWYKQRLQFLCGSTKNYTGTNRDSRVYGSIKNHTGKNRDYRVYAVLQRFLLVQMKVHCLCGSTKNHAGTTRDSRVYVVLQRITLVQIGTSRSVLFYQE